MVLNETMRIQAESAWNEPAVFRATIAHAGQECMFGWTHGDVGILWACRGRRNDAAGQIPVRCVLLCGGSERMICRRWLSIQKIAATVLA